MKYKYRIYNKNKGEIISGFENRKDAVGYLLENYRYIDMVRKFTHNDGKEYDIIKCKCYNPADELYNYVIECYSPDTLELVTFDDEIKEEYRCSL